MRKKGLFACALLIGLGFSAPTFAEDAADSETYYDEIEVSPNFEPDEAPVVSKPAEPVVEDPSRHAINEIPYTSGGIGSDDMLRLKDASSNYNLKVICTLNSGHYLSDVVIQIKDAKGELILDTLSEGPVFLAKLEPGNYTIEASVRNEPFSKKVTIGKADKSGKLPQREIYFRWKGNEPNYNK